MINHSHYSVLRNAALGDCTGNGLSSRIDSGWTFWNCTSEEAIKYCKEKNIDPTKCFIVVERMLWGEDHSYAEPLIKPKNAAQVFGGNFLYTSDGNSFKFKGMSTSSPIPVHDRFESWEQFDAMSR